MGGLMAFGVARIASYPAWKVLFLLFGDITLLWGVLMLLLVLDGPASAPFFTPRERQIAVARVSFTQLDGKGNYDSSYVIEALKDPSVYLLSIYSLLHCICNGALANFSTIVVSGFGFSTFSTLLLQVPNSVLTMLVVLGTSWLAHKVPSASCYLAMILILTGLVGAIMVGEIDPRNHVARLIGMYLFSCMVCAFPLVLSLLTSNVAGHTKKTFSNAMLFVTYCAGNTAGLQVFLAKEAPSYPTAFATMIGCLAGALIAMILYRILLARENNRRDRLLGVPVVASSVEGFNEQKNDLTDKQ
ncbi:major facilitator superfamily domain-containing protein [Dactylonectria macrodidyma]|uniref:Major facilitator superfamily domain-containing protein n=1 Tax=Dactylonectria macrodidyma TaxID=307937 RepID=A0A9P9IP06_9HYPO|nr:major facilitator superfamily domain-containing protein [Dactylonectria macrodidyma]